MGNESFTRFEAMLLSAVTACDGGWLSEAERLCDAIMAAKPDSIDVLRRLANVQTRLGRRDDALASYDRALALRPHFPEALNSRGVVLWGLKRYEDALASYDRALTLCPDYPEALNNRGLVLWRVKRYEEALASYNRALALRPDYAEALNNRGVVLNELRRNEDALASCDRASAVRPGYADAVGNRGNTLRLLRRFDEALASCDEALALRPDSAEALNNRGLVLKELDRFDDALSSYEQALALHPDYVDVLNNRGNVLVDLYRFEEALASYDRAVALSPDFAKCFTNRGLCRLRLGRYIDGWADYERRWDDPDFLDRRHRPGFVDWSGESLEARRLLVFSEQGLGDTIQFVRYLPLLARNRCRLTFLTSAKMVRLLRSLPSEIEVVSVLAGEQMFDFQCALMSLPHRLRTDLSSIPGSVPYLRAEDALVARWRDHMGPHGFKVGICWQGHPEAPGDHGRSIPLHRFQPLGRIPGARLISLQKLHGLEQLAELPAGMTIETLGEDFDAGPDALVDCAAVMRSLDLVVTCDTAIAHLAGALGQAVWLVLQQVPHWPWMLNRSDSPWYPSMRLFRQTTPGAWESVFDEIAAELRKLAHGDGSRHEADSAEPSRKSPLVPVSWGELIDKITILEVKSEQLTSPQDLAHVRRELAALEGVAQASGCPSSRVSELRASLRAINTRLYDIENAIREREARQQFDDEFIQLARSVYFSNDERGRIKREINAILNSELVEAKQYVKY